MRDAFTCCKHCKHVEEVETKPGVGRCALRIDKRGRARQVPLDTYVCEKFELWNCEEALP